MVGTLLIPNDCMALGTCELAGYVLERAISELGALKSCTLQRVRSSISTRRLYFTRQTACCSRLHDMLLLC